MGAPEFVGANLVTAVIFTSSSTGTGRQISVSSCAPRVSRRAAVLFVRMAFCSIVIVTELFNTIIAAVSAIVLALGGAWQEWAVVGTVLAACVGMLAVHVVMRAVVLGRLTARIVLALFSVGAPMEAILLVAAVFVVNHRVAVSELMAEVLVFMAAPCGVIFAAAFTVIPEFVPCLRGSAAIILNAAVPGEVVVRSTVVSVSGHAAVL